MTTDTPVDDIALYLDGASDDIDRVVSRSGKVKTPFYTWGADIAQACCEIAAWKFADWTGGNPESDGQHPLRVRGEKALAWLMAAANEGTLPGTVDATPSIHEGRPRATSAVAKVGW